MAKVTHTQNHAEFSITYDNSNSIRHCSTEITSDRHTQVSASNRTYLMAHL